MSGKLVYVTNRNGSMAVTDVEAAAGIISEMSGAYEHEVARDLRGGITFECDGIVFTPDVVADRVIEDRVTAILSPVERHPFPAGRKA